MADLANPIKAGMSWGEFLAVGEEWQRWELVDGEVEFMSPAGTGHGRVMWKLIPLMPPLCELNGSFPTVRVIFL
jgi:Uma2 family endonuclease